jgi:hypothetical protein
VTENLTPESGVWIKLNEPGRFDRAVCSYMIAYLRDAMRCADKLTQKGLAETEGLARHRMGRLLRALDLVSHFKEQQRARRGHTVNLEPTKIHLSCPRCSVLNEMKPSGEPDFKVGDPFDATCSDCGAEYFFILGRFGLIDQEIAAPEKQ